MRILRGLRIALVIGISFGLVMPHVNVSAAQVEESPAIFTDVALDASGILHGQVTTVNGSAAKGVQVAVQQESREIAQTTTDSEGRFGVAGLKGGIYTVSTSEGGRTYRVWTHRAAPPTATQGILFVNDREMIRAQGPLVSRFGVGALIVGALVTAIIWTSVDQNKGS